MANASSHPNTILDKILGLEIIRDGLSVHDLEDFGGYERAYPDQSFPEIIGRITEKRISIYFDAIERQLSMQEAGIARIRTLRENFGYYANGFLGGHVNAAIADVYQQETDANTMVSFSHSFLHQARNIGADERSSGYVRAKKAMDYQFTLYQEFERSARQEDAGALERAKIPCQYSPHEIVKSIQDIEVNTLDVANANMDLANVNLDLFENIAQGLYFWIKNAKQGASTSLGNKLLPLQDIDDEKKSLDLCLQRIGAYTKRAQGLYKLADKISSEDDSGILSTPSALTPRIPSLYLSPPNHL